MPKAIPSTSALTIPFYCIRRITSPEDDTNDRKVFSGQIPIDAIKNIPTNENVREFLLDAEGLKRKVPTQVHRAIKDTLENNANAFSVLNGGIVLVARNCEVDEKKKQLHLTAPSIINGSQTQGIVREYLNEYEYDPSDPIHIRFELIITDDQSLVAEISISRNFQNDVKPLSIAGRRGYFTEIGGVISKAFPEMRLSTSETERPSNEIMDTEKLLKIIAALKPSEFCQKPGEVNKAYTYDRARTCLKEFENIYCKAKEPDIKDATEKDMFKALYKYYLDIAPSAWELFIKWKTHQGFKGCGLRSITREDKKIIDVPEGIVWPILAAHSEFVVKKGSKWKLDIPPQFDERRLITAALDAYKEIAKSKPEAMGKMKACYSSLQNITSIYRELANFKKTA